MEPVIPKYIEARIRREPVCGSPVLPGATPVPSFGDLRIARVATVGWNPSKREFFDSNGNELQGEQRRLETLQSLGVNSLSSAPAESIISVFNACSTYFSRRPYWWFKKLDAVLRQIGATYYADASGELESACHLDFVQNATNPGWADLDRSTKDSLIASDVSFLREQLASASLRLLLLNGTGIIRAYDELVASSPLIEVERLRFGRVQVFRGMGMHGCVVIGWNINLQRTPGVSNSELDSLGNSIARALKS